MKSLISVVLLLLIIMLLLAGCNVPDLSFAEQVTVRYVCGEDESTVVITDAEDVDALTAALTEDTEAGSGNCGFTELELLFEGEDRLLSIHPATDGCNTVFYRRKGDQYYVMSSEKKKIMLDTLYEYGVPLDYDYLCENMFEEE